MAKEITAQVKLQLTGGRATPAPPVGTALGPHGIDMNAFVTQFNDQTKQDNGTVLPVVVTIYKDRTFTFIIKTPPAAFLIKEAIKKDKGAANQKTETVGTLKDEQVAAIAEKKLVDLSARDMDAAKKIIAGTARSMGVKVE
jgi:large subunit ribosomal protein L11